MKRPIQNSKTETKIVKASAEADQQQTRTNKSNQKEHANQHQCGRLCSTLHFVFETSSRKKKTTQLSVYDYFEGFVPELFVATKTRSQNNTN